MRISDWSSDVCSSDLHAVTVDADNSNTIEWSVDVAAGIAEAFIELTGFTTSDTTVVTTSATIHIVEPQPRIFNVNPFVQSMSAIWSRGAAQTIRYNTTGPLQAVELQLYEGSRLEQVQIGRAHV